MLWQPAAAAWLCYAQNAHLRSNLSLQNISLHIFGCVQSCRTGVRFFGGHTSDQTQATSRVWQLPPMESFRKCVSLDERYGTCLAFFLERAMMTCKTA